MSAPLLGKIQQLYAEVDQLNREAMARLAAAESPLGLGGLFQRKGVIARELEELSSALQEFRQTKPGEELQAAFEAQKRAALTEVQLAEQLSLWRQGSLAMQQAYGRLNHEGPRKPGGLDRAG